MERWKPISDFSFYEVSDMGNVRSVGGYRSNGKGSRFVKSCQRKVFNHRNGYLYLSISQIETGKRVNVYVHRLVAAAFVDGYHAGLEVNHKDGNKKNNVYSNLEWVSGKQNLEHADKILNKRPKGEKHGRKKLTEKQVLTIRKMAETPKEIAAIYRISESQVGNIISRRSWKHI